MERFKWNRDLEEELKGIFYLYTNKEISLYFDSFKKLSDIQIMKKGNDLKLHKSGFILGSRGNNLSIDFKERYNIYIKYTNIKNGNKLCLHCYRVLKDNSDYFFVKKGETKSICKECEGHNFTNKLIHVPKQGYKFCIKCDEELLIDIKFFPPDKDCRDGFRNICRECGKDGHFMEDGYIPKEWWSKENDKLFLKIYSDYTNSEIIKLFFPNETRKSLDDKAFRMGKINKTVETMKRVQGEKSENYSGENNWNYGKPKSEETKRKLSEAKKGKYLGENNWLYGKHQTMEQRKNLSIAKRKIGKWKGNKNPRHIFPLDGELNGRWLGGISSERNKIMRTNEYKEWRAQVFKRDNYICQCCGDKKGHNLEAHHIENFSSNKELRFDIDNGITLCNKCHNPNQIGSLHNIYGTKNNTKQQLEQYTKMNKRNKELKEVG